MKDRPGRGGVQTIARWINARLWLWIPFAIALGLWIEPIARLRPVAVLLLGLIVAGVAVTLKPAGFRGLQIGPAMRLSLGHVLMIPIAWLIGLALGLPAIHIAGLVLLGASTPDLTAPLLSRIARGDTHTSLLLLAITGLLSILLIPLATILLIDPGLRVPVWDLLLILLAGVLLPAALGSSLNRIAPGFFHRSCDGWTLVSTLATLAITALVAAVNRDRILTSTPETPHLLLVTAAVLLFATGLFVGLIASGGPKRLHTATLFIPGTREYALAAGLVLAAGFPPAAALIPLFFGAVQMILAPLLANRIAHRRHTAPPTG